MKRKLLVALVVCLGLFLMLLIAATLVLNKKESAGSSPMHSTTDNIDRFQESVTGSISDDSVVIPGTVFVPSTEKPDTHPIEESTSETESFPAELGVVEGVDDGDLNDQSATNKCNETTAVEYTESENRDVSEKSETQESSPETEGNQFGEMGVTPGQDDGSL